MDWSASAPRKACARPATADEKGEARRAAEMEIGRDDDVDDDERPSRGRKRRLATETRSNSPKRTSSEGDKVSSELPSGQSALSLSSSSSCARARGVRGCRACGGRAEPHTRRTNLAEDAFRLLSGAPCLRTRTRESDSRFSLGTAGAGGPADRALAWWWKAVLVPAPLPRTEGERRGEPSVSQSVCAGGSSLGF